MVWPKFEVSLSQTQEGIVTRLRDRLFSLDGPCVNVRAGSSDGGLNLLYELARDLSMPAFSGEMKMRHLWIRPITLTVLLAVLSFVSVCAIAQTDTKDKTASNTVSVIGRIQRCRIFISPEKAGIDRSRASSYHRFRPPSIDAAGTFTKGPSIENNLSRWRLTMPSWV